MLLEVTEEYQLFQRLHQLVVAVEQTALVQMVIPVVLAEVAVELIMVAQETVHQQIRHKVRMEEMVVHLLKVHKVIVAVVAVVPAQQELILQMVNHNQVIVVLLVTEVKVLL